MPSSRGEHSIPSETTPRISRAASGSGSGRHARSRAPRTGLGRRPPCSERPTTTSRSPSHRVGRGRGRACREFGWSRTSRTRATTTPSRPAHGCSIDSTCSPLRSRRSRELLRATRSTGQNSRSHDRTTFTRPPRTAPGSARRSHRAAGCRGCRSGPSPGGRYPTAEREARVPLGVVADVLKHRRVHHARRPSSRSIRLRAGPAPGAAAHETRHRRPGAGLDEREEGRA